MNINFDNVSFKYIEKPILDKASFSITDSDKIGLVGTNGTGKSTLLKLIMGLEKPNSGEINISGGMRINFLEQQPSYDINKSILEIVMEGSTKENPIQEYEAESILTKMGFTDLSITTKDFSGGELKRVALAKAIVTPCDILILDEPTNHLDSNIILWLEKYLMKWKKGLLMVTHDRYFLQRVCNKMMELEFGKIYLYEANYDKFLELKAKRLDDLEHSKQKLKKLLKQETEWINRGVEARRTKSKSRIENFKKLKEIKFNENKEMEFTSVETYLGKKILIIENGSKKYSDKILFNDFNFILNREDIVGVVGNNGCGKSTLFKIIMDEEKLDSGNLIKGETLKIGYFSQHLDLINPEIRVIDYIKEESSIIETLDGSIDCSTLLEEFLFDKDLQYSKVKMLSGGEKRRLQLIRVLSTNPNVLILDEPTNDLDLYTLEILENYLLSFKGPIMVTSHDRYFLDKICNRLLIYKNSNIIESIKSYSDYLNEEEIKESKPNDSVKGKRPSNKMPASLRNELNKLEEEIPNLENKVKLLKEEINNNTTDYHKLVEIQEDIDKLTNDISIKTDRYFELLEMKEEYNG
jgi:ATP-binding cassette subfamily F protein uup